MINDYPFIIRKLSLEDGGGYLIEYPDLPGCMSDGETKEEALSNGEDAVRCWLEAARGSGREIPTTEENSLTLYSGRWVQRAPKSLHAELTKIAKMENVSLNTLVIALLTEGAEKKRHEYAISAKRQALPKSLAIPTAPSQSIGITSCSGAESVPSRTKSALIKQNKKEISKRKS